jgi:hypothetical protein
MESKKCIFCKEGTYEEFATSSTDPRVISNVQELGLRTIAKNNWKILICNKCGNMQFFRQDLIGE